MPKKSSRPRISVTLDPRTLELLESVCATEHLSASELVDMALKFYCAYLADKRLESVVAMRLASLEDAMAGWAKETQEALEVARATSETTYQALLALASITNTSLSQGSGEEVA